MKEMMAPLRTFWVLARPALVLLLALFTGVGLTMGSWDGSPWVALRALLPIMSFIVAAVAANDLADWKVDALNLPGSKDRPLASKLTSRSTMAIVAATAACTALLSSLLVGPVTLLAVTAGLLMALVYSYFLSSKGFLGALFLPLGYTAVPYLSGLESAGGALSAREITVLLFLYAGFLGRILLKDFRDLNGDRLLGKRTFLVRHGKAATIYTSAALWTLGLGAPFAAGLGPAAVISYLAQGFGVLVLLSVLLGQDRRKESHTISAIAILGRGGLLTFILAGQVPGLLGVVVIVLAAVIMLVQAWRMQKNGPAGSGVSMLELSRSSSAPLGEPTTEGAVTFPNHR